MCEELINMINEDRIKVYQYFTMNPYSHAGNATYSEVNNEINFLDDINVLSNKTFERLAVLAKIAQNKVLNTLIITGYRGSGKSNFLRFCDALINNKTSIKNYNDVCKEYKHLYSIETSFSPSDDDDSEPDFFDENSNAKIINELGKIRKKFRVSVEKIRETLENDFKYKSDNEIRNEIAPFLNGILQGESIYLDFDEGKKDNEAPLELKLTRQIEEHVKKLSIRHISDLFHFYEKNKACFTKSFENRSEFLFENALKFIYNNKENDFENYKSQLLVELRDLEIDQMLALEVLLEITEAKERNIVGSLYYFLDNLDMISGQENSVLIKTISNFWKFTEEMQSFINSLRQDKKMLCENQPWIDIYDKIIYIFAMRETTAMHIGDHLRSRIQQYAEHFDMSADVNKSFIIKKRYDLLKKYIDEGRITNQIFIKIMNTIEAITEDKYYKWSFFPIFNNDYRTAINCLYQICIESNNVDILYNESEPLLRKHENYKKFGGRGIIIKILCDSFRNWGYFSDLKIGTPATATAGSRYSITMIRMILTVLQNLQKERTGNMEFRFFVEREQSVSIKNLYEKVQYFCEKKMFLNCIENMFSMRNSNYWNHFITFDNMLEYSEDDIKKGIDGKKDIYIRCTEVGEMYLKILCIHYEFFASRNRCKNNGLFCEVNHGFTSEKKDSYIFQNQIEKVFDKVSECCKALRDFNRLLLNNIGGNDYNDLLQSEYVIDEKFHEERIIHNHISYLDAYRLYLINGPLKNDITNINKLLIDFIEKYLELLKDNDKVFYSNNSEKLYKELKCCIKVISEIHEYNDKNTVISREHYEKIKDKYGFNVTV